MKTRRIGALETSCLGIGAMSFADFYGATTEENSQAILDLAQELGVRHIDTSNVYGMGRSERAIGAWLRANPGAREGLHIATKAGITQDAEGNRRFDNSLEHMEAELDASLERLGTDCVDLFYVHRYQAEIPVEEVAGTMGRLVEAGKCRSIGFSEIAPSTLRLAHAAQDLQSGCRWPSDCEPAHPQLAAAPPPSCGRPEAARTLTGRGRARPGRAAGAGAWGAGGRRRSRRGTTQSSTQGGTGRSPSPPRRWPCPRRPRCRA